MARTKIRRPRVLTNRQVRAQASVIAGRTSTVARAAMQTAQTGPAAEDPNATVGELWLYGIVGGWWRGFSAASVAEALADIGDVDILHVRIHSPGGLADDGIAISNLLRNFDAKVVTIVDGTAASAASVIAVAGDEVVMCPGSQLMLHDASTYAYGPASTLRLLADWVDGQSQNYAGVYTYRAGGTPQQWRDAMQANDQYGTWYTAEAAVAAKLADRVGTVVATGAPPDLDVDDELDEEDEDEELLARAAHDLALLEQCVHPAAAAAWRGEPIKPPSARPRSGPTTTQETESAVAFSDEQITTMRQELGLPETADEATIVSALAQALEERADAPAATGVPEGHVVIPQARLADLEAGAAAGTAAAQKLHNQEREAFLDANRTKYAPVNRAAWAAEYDRDPKGTREHFAKAADIVSEAELGTTGDDPDQSTGDTLAEVRETPAYANWSL